METQFSRIPNAFGEGLNNFYESLFKEKYLSNDKVHSNSLHIFIDFQKARFKVIL
jgi:hypothetical protein